MIKKNSVCYVCNLNAERKHQIILSPAGVSLKGIMLLVVCVCVFGGVGELRFIGTVFEFPLCVSFLAIN